MYRLYMYNHSGVVAERADLTHSNTTHPEPRSHTTEGTVSIYI